MNTLTNNIHEVNSLSLFDLISSCNIVDTFPKEEIMRDPEAFFTACPRSIINILNLLNYLNARCKKIYATQTWIGIKCGIVRETVNRRIKQLCDLGFICKKNRGIKKSCIYVLTPWFKKYILAPRLVKYLRIYLGDLYPVLGYPRITDPEPNVTQEYKKGYIYKTQCNSSLCTDIKNAKKGEVKRSSTIRRLRRGYKNIREGLRSIAGRRIRPIYQKDESKVMIAPILEQYHVLGLTLHGKIKLSVYPEAALKHAYIQYKNTKGTINHPFELFKSYANEYCKKQRIDIFWGEYFVLLEQHNVDRTEPFTTIKQPVVHGNDPEKQPSRYVSFGYNHVVTEPPKSDFRKSPAEEAEKLKKFMESDLFKSASPALQDCIRGDFMRAEKAALASVN